MTDKSEFYTEDGKWSCIKEGVTEPCGDCFGCRLVRSENRAKARNKAEGRSRGEIDD